MMQVSELQTKIFECCLEKLNFLFIVREEIWSIFHTLSTSLVPNKPSGLNYQITNIIKYGAINENPLPNLMLISIQY